MKPISRYQFLNFLLCVSQIPLIKPQKSGWRTLKSPLQKRFISSIVSFFWKKSFPPGDYIFLPISTGETNKHVEVTTPFTITHILSKNGKMTDQKQRRRASKTSIVCSCPVVIFSKTSNINQILEGSLLLLQEKNEEKESKKMMKKKKNTTYKTGKLYLLRRME